MEGWVDIEKKGRRGEGIKANHGEPAGPEC